MKLKVCGMKYQNNINAVAALQPDYLGLIFYDKSPRNVDTQFSELPVNIKKTGVFVNASIPQVIHKIGRYNLDAIQLHGNESPAYCKALREAKLEIQTGKDTFVPYQFEIIKVFSIKDEFDFSVLQPYEGIVDYFLFDTKGQLPGGNGYTFNWSILEQYPSTTPYFLSGGIGLNEIENIKAFQENPASKYCYAIDVNSKFEIEPGLKDIEELKEFKQSLSC